MAEARNRKRFGGKWLVIVLVVAAIAAAAAVTAVLKGRGRSVQSQFQLQEITRGNLENVVSSTGVIEAVGTVEIGTQVSGAISRICVDFNDQVRAGQLLAVLDTVPLRASVLDAQASLKRAEAQLEKAAYDYRQNLPLYERGLVSESEFMTMKIAVPTQEASVQSARAALDRAEFNFANALHPVADQRDGHRAQRRTGADRGGELQHADALSHRGESLARRNTRRGGRERHRPDTERSVGPVRGARLPG